MAGQSATRRMRPTNRCCHPAPRHSLFLLVQLLQDLQAQRGKGKRGRKPRWLAFCTALLEYCKGECGLGSMCSDVWCSHENLE